MPCERQPRYITKGTILYRCSTRKHSVVLPNYFDSPYTGFSSPGLCYRACSKSLEKRFNMFIKQYDRSSILRDKYNKNQTEKRSFYELKLRYDYKIKKC